MLDLQSLQSKDRLNQDIWDDDARLDPEVRSRLLDIALDFYNQLDVPWADLKDIVFTGSLANYNWSKYSDIDLHLVIDFEQVDENRTLVGNYFNAKRRIWNNKFDIDVKGFEVEVYIEDTRKPAVSAGAYSILHDDWIRTPTPGQAEIDKKAVEQKARTITNFVDDVKNLLRKNEYSGAIRVSEYLWKKVKKMRQCGLEAGGEYSVENLAYKILRRNKSIQKLHDVKIEAYEKLMSLD